MLAHVRRKFTDVEHPNSFCKSIIKLINKLFEIESDAWQKSAEERLSLRDKKSRKIIAKIYELVDVESYSGRLVKGKLRKAVVYIINQRKNLCYFLVDANLRIENNVSERNIRKLTLGRKNWLFFGSENGGKMGSVFYSLIQTCRNLKINPQEYLDDVLRKLPVTAEKEYKTLLPHHWKQS